MNLYKSNKKITVLIFLIITNIFPFFSFFFVLFDFNFKFDRCFFLVLLKKNNLINPIMTILFQVIFIYKVEIIL